MSIVEWFARAGLTAGVTLCLVEFLYRAMYARVTAASVFGADPPLRFILVVVARTWLIAFTFVSALGFIWTVNL